MAGNGLSLPSQQLVARHAENLGQRGKLDVGNKAKPALYTLHGVFVHVDTGELEPVGQRALRQINYIMLYLIK